MLECLSMTYPLVYYFSDLFTAWKRHVNCDFDDVFICGYTLSQRARVPDWTRHKRTVFETDRLAEDVPEKEINSTVW